MSFFSPRDVVILDTLNPQMQGERILTRKKLSQMYLLCMDIRATVLDMLHSIVSLGHLKIYYFYNLKVLHILQLQAWPKSTNKQRTLIHFCHLNWKLFYQTIIVKKLKQELIFHLKLYFKYFQLFWKFINLHRIC